MNRALALRTGTPALRVILYVLTTVGKDPGGHFTELQGLAARSPWTVTGRASDSCGDSDPPLRPGWTQALKLIATGRADAVASVSRTAISPHPGPYLQALDALSSLGGGLLLLRAETHL
ncbi:hypothetical protein [Streptomyces tsukubensis]|uniref:hypothetical protein n=1 Tax=Streptomyces tsukubensis TaxID=83656 RepID=UPI00344D5494